MRPSEIIVTAKNAALLEFGIHDAGNPRVTYGYAMVVCEVLGRCIEKYEAYISEVDGAGGGVGEAGRFKTAVSRWGSAMLEAGVVALEVGGITIGADPDSEMPPEDGLLFWDESLRVAIAMPDTSGLPRGVLGAVGQAWDAFCEAAEEAPALVGGTISDLADFAGETAGRVIGGILGGSTAGVAKAFGIPTWSLWAGMAVLGAAAVVLIARKGG